MCVTVSVGYLGSSTQGITRAGECLLCLMPGRKGEFNQDILGSPFRHRVTIDFGRNLGD